MGGKREGVKCVLVSLDGLVDLLFKYCDPNLPLFAVWSCEDSVVGVRVECAKSTRVVACIDCVNQPQIGKVVNIDAIF